MGYEHVRQRQFDDIEIGEPIATAIKLLGEPIRKQRDFRVRLPIEKTILIQKHFPNALNFSYGETAVTGFIALVLMMLVKSLSKQMETLKQIDACLASPMVG